jgi:hypothetical protein
MGRLGVMKIEKPGQMTSFFYALKRRFIGERDERIHMFPFVQ